MHELRACMQEDGVARKAANDPLLKVPFTAELGNVTPALMVPGEYTAQELKAAAAAIVFGTLNNAGCNCLAIKTVVMAAEWPQVRPPRAPHTFHV
jgi:aldehyde dehydrogenase (NAD(P)+)